MDCLTVIQPIVQYSIGISFHAQHFHEKSKECKS
jgi:hypothetical protein